MRTGVDFKTALLIALAVLVVSAVLVTPLVVRVSGREAMTELAPVVAGAAISGTAIIVCLEAPVLLALRWAVGIRFSVSSIGWAVVGSLVAVSPWVVLNTPGEPIWGKITGMIELLWSDPATASYYLPFVLAGGVFAWYWPAKYEGPRASRRMEPTRRES